jgi:hypothetical protein
MAHRSFAAMAVASAVIATLLISANASGQTRPAAPASTARKWTTPHTPWGDPDCVLRDSVFLLDRQNFLLFLLRDFFQLVNVIIGKLLDFG